MANLGSVNIVDINLDEDDVEQVDEEERKYIEKLGQQIDDLEEERSALKKQVQEMNETLQDEKEENGRRKGQMDTMKQELQQALITIQEQSELLKKVAEKSEMAYKEYQDMEQTYRKEFVVRNEAERFAKKLCTERDQARRESSMALSKVADNKKLMDALLEIQELNSKTAQMKDDFGKQILDLQEQLKATKEVYNAEKLEAENEELNLEKDTLQDKLEKRETEMTELRTKYTYLQETYKALEMKYQKATAIPPPPPPPPPPPLTASKVGGFLSKIVGRKGQRERAKEQLKKGGVSIDDNHSKAIEEMMNRIKSGNVGLRPTLQRRTSEDVELDEDFLQSLPDKEEPTAMNELQGLLSKMKKARSEDDLSVFEDTGVSDELGMILKKRHQLSQGAAPNSPPSLEPGRASRPVPAPRKLSTIQDGVEEP